MATFEIDAAEILDTRTFHETFKRVLVFPEFYGMNMDAWIDCMSDLHGPNSLCGLHLGSDEPVELKITNLEDFSNRCPVLFRDLMQCTAFVNRRYAKWKSPVRIRIVPE